MFLKILLSKKHKRIFHAESLYLRNTKWRSRDKIGNFWEKISPLKKSSGLIFLISNEYAVKSFAEFFVYKILLINQ